MENNVEDFLRCEEQLRTTLHCDDKEKLRKKLVLLQREYLRTVQRLQRAERSEAVQRHVRSRITEQNHQDHRHLEITSNPDFNPSSLTLDTKNVIASGEPQFQHAAAPMDSGSYRRSQMIRFQLPSDAAIPETPETSHNAARGHRASPALRLRSRRSRLRWERRSAEACRSTDNSEEGQEQSEKMETAGTEGSEERFKAEVAELVNESEELLSGTDSESPSLLLTHWNTCRQTETGNTEGKEIQVGQEQREKTTEMRAERKKESDSTSVLPICCNPGTDTEGRGQDGAKKGGKKATKEGQNSKGEIDGRLCDDSSNKNTEQITAEVIESARSHDKTVEVKEEKKEKGVGVLDSCTLVEGLLFPAEYYVRTTRRMSSSQSQPDMHAVILSQLSVGQHRRSRGRGRGSTRRESNHKHTDQHPQTYFSSMSAASLSAGPCVESQATDASELNSQSSSDISGQISACQISTDACFSSPVTAPHPVRGRRRRRGRGRGKSQIPRCSPISDNHQPGLGQTSDNPQLICCAVSSSPSLHGADEPKPCLTPGEAAPVPEDPGPASTHNTATQPSSVGNGAQSVYPIFLKRTNRSTQMSRGAASWRSLLLPSSPPAQTCLLPLPSLSPGPLLNNLFNFDIPQDFHLPDDQFASLKLHKLRRVALESGIEHFTSPSSNTHRGIQSYETCSDPMTPLPLQLSLTPTTANSPHLTEEKQAAQSVDLHNLSVENSLKGKLTSESLTEDSSDCETLGGQQTENLYPESQTHTTLAESVSVGQDGAGDCADHYKEKDTVILNTHGESSVSDSHTHRPVDQSVKLQPHITFTDRPADKVNEYVLSQSDELELNDSSVILLEEQKDCPGVAGPSEDPNQQTEDKAFIKTLYLDCPLQKAAEDSLNNCTAAQTFNDAEAAGESPVQHLNVKSPANESKESSEPTTSRPPENINQNRYLPPHSVPSQLLLSPSLASAPFITPHLHSSALPTSPTLPSLGLTPHLVPAALPLTSSPTAPALTLPPPHSPSTQALSPPALSPCPSLTSLPPSQPPSSPAGQIQAASEPTSRVEPATCPALSGLQSHASGGWVRTEESVEERMMRCTHTLEAPAGGCLVDACCLPGSSGGLRVAAAGKWAVCLWSQTSDSEWSLTQTWAFNEPVISVFPVPDAAGLMCVTLGQLEIREVRVLSCSSHSQVLLCGGVVQAVVGVSQSRVVTSSHSASGSSLQVFTLSDSGSTLSSQPLVSPGVCVGALAPVDGIPNALIGTDEGGNLFVWNLKTGQLLRRIILGDGLSHTACLRGYSYCGVLFVLLQHQFLSSLEEEEERETVAKDQMFSEEEEKKKTVLFSLVAVNPLSGKSVLATRLYPPKAWSGRLCEADVNSSSVVGLSQSGCVCVWELGCRGASRMVWAPESEGWQLARWGGGGTLVTGHHNGDVTLLCDSTSQTSLCH